MLLSQRWKFLWQAGQFEAIPKCLSGQPEEQCSVICQRTCKKTGRCTSAIHKPKRGCSVLDFLGHSQDISGLSNQHSGAPLIQATSGGRGAMSSSYWSNLPSLCYTQLAIREVKLPVQEARSHLDLWLAEIEGRHRDLPSISWSELLSIIGSRLLPVSIWPAAEKIFEHFQRGDGGLPNC